jgi:O-Antigen ligase
MNVAGTLRVPLPIADGTRSVPATNTEIITMRFFLFILANAMLFIRPSELIADLAAVEIYRYFIIACLVVSLPLVVQQLTLRYPGVPPTISCVLLLLPAVFMSGFFHGNFELIQETVIEFTKVVIYFALLISLLTDTGRLRRFLFWISLFSAAVTLAAVLRYHADIALPPPPEKANPGNKDKIHGTYVVDKVRDPQTGEMVAVQRMCGTGIFNDPNDFALVLVAAIPLCLFWLTDPTRKALRPVWLVLLLFFGYALMLTHSRGGFLALVAGMVTLVHLKYGGKKTIMLGLLFVPLLFAAFAGRMTSMSADEGTGQARIQLWSDALFIFRQSPLIGIGMENYRQFSSHVAHNSFLHCYTEVGVIGGTLFLGAFFFALTGMYGLRNRDQQAAADIDPELRRLYPFLMATLVAYTIGICFLSRSYIVPTFMILGLAVAYQRLHTTQAPVPPPSWLLAWPRLAGVSFSFLIASYAFCRVFVKY